MEDVDVEIDVPVGVDDDGDTSDVLSDFVVCIDDENGVDIISFADIASNDVVIGFENDVVTESVEGVDVIFVDDVGNECIVRMNDAVVSVKSSAISDDVSVSAAEISVVELFSVEFKVNTNAQGPIRIANIC